jgi:hypothetical protein
MARVICLLILVSFMCICTSYASEEVAIRAILEHPESYHIHEVILKGTVQQVQIMEPSAGAGGPCYGATTFTLVDETGSIIVDIPVVCGKRQMQYEPPRVSNGDRVVIHAQIQAPGYYAKGGLSGLGENRTTIRAVASDISKNSE